MSTPIGPWQSYGTYLRDKVLRDSHDAVVAAHLDWEVSKKPVYFQKDDKAKTYTNIPKKYAIVRKDTSDETPLGVVGSVFTPVQNERAFAYMDSIITSSKASPKFYAAGELDHGKKVWVLVDMNNSVTIDGDSINNYLLLSNGHDGLTTLDIGILNMSSYGVTYPQHMSLYDKKAFFRFKHTTQLAAMDSKGNMDKIKAAIKSVSDRFQRFAQAANLLAGKTVESKELDDFLLRVEQINQDNIDSFRGSNKYHSMRTTGHSTLWQAFNGVSNYIDFHAKSRNTTIDSFDRGEARLKSAWFGAGAQKKARAFKIAIEMAGGDKSNLRELDIEEYGL